jgi:hypothetical protein
MSNILELNCWVIGDEPHSIFPVKIASSEMVGYMRKAILPRAEHHTHIWVQLYIVQVLDGH